MTVITVQSDSEFESQLDKAEGRLVVVHFSAEWAPQCKQMHDVLVELSKDDDLKDSVVFVQLESESLPKISLKYEISAVPTFVLLKNRDVLEKVNGANALELTKSVRQHAKGGCPPSRQTLKPPVEDINVRLKTLTNAAPCMIFMKGSPKEPKCGFSRQLVALLDGLSADYSTFDILSDDAVRQGLKEYSQWPTYPQVYIKGELIGGLDIIKEMDQSGELKALLPKKTSIEDRLKLLINKAPITVFMKGNRDVPRCGFSKQLIGLLDTTGLKYETFDILEDEEVRQELKTYSNWPTYPQIYASGQLVGGLDILKELQEAGELLTTLQPSKE